MVLQRHVQTINRTEEIGVTVGCKTAGTLGHKIVGLCGRVAAELREHIGPRFDVVKRTQVTTIIQGTKVFQFQTRKRQACFLRRVADR